MDDVQSWWEVPSIAHFCYVFRDAFNLLFIDVAELEAAILNMQDPEMCVSLDQLLIRILEGCFEENEVNTNNWEKKLFELFDDNCDENENLLNKDYVFATLPVRRKVEILLKLCEFRLDADGALEAIKDIPAEDMQATCVGKDMHNNIYWYFGDERLYKEDPSVKPVNSKKKEKAQDIKETKKPQARNEKRSNLREKKEKKIDVPKAWSIVCHNLSDWEALVTRFSKSKNKAEQKTALEMKEKCMPKINDIIAEKDRLIRKRLIDLAPKRLSSRISKLNAQKQMEEQMAAEAAETKKMETEKERAKKEVDKKKQEREDRVKRFDERQKLVLERQKRAQLRSLMRGGASEDDDSNSVGSSTLAIRRSDRKTVKKRCSEYRYDNEEESDEHSSSTNGTVTRVSKKLTFRKLDSKFSKNEESQESSNSVDSNRKSQWSKSTSVKKREFTNHKNGEQKEKSVDNSEDNSNQESDQRTRRSTRTVVKKRYSDYQYDSEEESDEESDKGSDKESDEGSDKASDKESDKESDEGSDKESDEGSEEDAAVSSESEAERPSRVFASQDQSPAESGEDESSNEECGSDSSVNIFSPAALNGKVARALGRPEQNGFGSSREAQNSFSAAQREKWKASIDARGQKVHVLQYSLDEEPENKRLKNSHHNHSNSSEKLSSNGLRSTLHNEHRNHHPFQQRNFNSCSTLTSSPSIIRLGFIKPTVKPQVSQ